jgi:hypothetical protein
VSYTKRNSLLFWILRSGLNANPEAGELFDVGASFGLVQGPLHSSLVADGELPAPPGTPTGKHGAAILGGHARTEPVDFGALPVIGLKRTLRHFFLADSGRAGRGPV